MKLIIVESPTKKKTIQKYVGSDFIVAASVGHIRDIADQGEFNLGIDVTGGSFKPTYAVMKDKVNVVKSLKDLPAQIFIHIKYSKEEIISAINYAHLFNVKVYLTVNTLIKEKEFSSVLEYIKPFYEAGLDACIVQDLGLISVFKSNFPNMECHISTQAFATGLSSVRFYKSLGASRVVLARELSLKEIKYIKENKVKSIVLWKLDRISRSTEDFFGFTVSNIKA